ncbi:sensor histidine kinase [Pseudoclavibacter helvolus]|uniref:sensor histidine kinase n=1 Tax=Pseudoclavibacter helvolus TaxID=255205 RepID=UPI003C72FCE4
MHALVTTGSLRSPDSDQHSHSAALALRLSMRRAVLIGLAVWNLVMLLVLLMAGLDLLPLLISLCLHGTVAVLAIWCSPRTISAWPVLVLAYGLGLADWVVSGDINAPLTFAACWLVNLSAIAAVFSLRPVPSVLVVGAAACTLPLLLWVLNPHWGPDLPKAVLVTQLAILIVGLLGLGVLDRFARNADREATDARLERRTLEVRAQHRRALAESARTLHDTVVNTLGSIASGGAATRDTAAVREQCVRDLHVLNTILGSAPPENHADPRLAQLFENTPLPIRRTGLSDEELESCSRNLSPAQIMALVGAAQEMMRNVAKHSGVPFIEVETKQSVDALVVAVADRGRGFDGRPRPGRGLANSVIARMEDAGGTVEVRASPGVGTSGVLRMPFQRRGTNDGNSTKATGDAHALATALHSRAATVWALGVTAVGVILEALNRSGEMTGAYAMLALNVLGVVLARSGRPTSELTKRLLVGTLLAISVATFILSASAVDFGARDAVLWQALGPTACLVLVTTLQATGRAVRWTTGIYGGAVSVAAMIVAGTSVLSASIVLLAGIVGIGFVLAWRYFQGVVDEIAATVARQQELTYSASVDAELQSSLFGRRSYWTRVRLREVRVLLSALADGSADPNDPSVRDQCAGEESYLRQILQISTQSVHLGTWLVEALNASYTGRNHLRLSVGDVDTDDEHLAQELGRLVLACVTATPPGAEVFVSVHSLDVGLMCTIVGATPTIIRVHDAVVPDSFEGEIELVTVDGHDVLQVRFADQIG